MMWRIGTLILAAGTSGWLGYLVSDRDIPTIVMEKGPDQPAYRPGDTFRADYKFFRKRACYLRVHRLMWDAHGERFVISDLIFQEGVLPLGHDQASVPAPIPKNIGVGRAVYRTVNCYQCNFTHIVWPLCDAPRDMNFEIVPNGATDGSSRG